MYQDGTWTGHQYRVQGKVATRGASLAAVVDGKFSDMNASYPTSKVVNLCSHLCGYEINVQKLDNAPPVLYMGKCLMMNKSRFTRQPGCHVRNVSC